MQVVITAVGPDNRGLADPIVHSVTGMGANIAEIQMYDHDEESVFSMLTRIELDPSALRRAATGDERRVEADASFRSAPGRRTSRAGGRGWRSASPIGRSRRSRCCGRFATAR